MPIDMMTLGDYVFSIESAPVDKLDRVAEYRWASQEAIGARPSWQWLGPGQETVTLSGVGFPAWRGGARQAEALRAAAAAGEPLRLMDGSGRVLGFWVVRRIEERRSGLLAGGGPRRIEYRLELALHAAPSASAATSPAIEDSGIALLGSAAEADFQRIELLPAEIRGELDERLSAIDRARSLERKGLSRLEALQRVAPDRAQELYGLLDETGLGAIPRRLWGPSELMQLAPSIPGQSTVSRYLGSL